MRTPTVELSAAPAVQGVPIVSTLGPRRLRDYEFVWLLSGSATVTLDDRQHTLVPGFLQLSRPGMVDRYQWHGTDTAHAYVHFVVRDRGRLPPPANWPVLVPMRPGGGLAGLAADLLDLRGESSTAATEVTALLLDRFVVGPAVRADETWDDPFLTQLAELLRRLWSDGTARRVPVEELAIGLGLSRSQTTRLVTDRCAVGPARAVELLRLARAASLLLRTNLTVATIAQVTGFADAFHLTRRFKATYGAAPGRYRLGGGTDRTAPLARHAHALVDLDDWLTKPGRLVARPDNAAGPAHLW